MQVVIMGRMPKLQKSLSSAPQGLGKQSRGGAVCSSQPLTHGPGQGSMGCAHLQHQGCRVPHSMALSLPGGISATASRRLQWGRGKWHGSTAGTAAWGAQHGVTAWNACAQTFPAPP